ncbi:MAG: alanine--tRNA ligase [Candidatus Nitrohelix vancouverensis]|uniref:Alanine--tRNA ligase n=1 Tax=Candidatus Nitrohelix vancouverensis TaxID=2705534 RepID=A0A7T0C3E7_9BACT|nr:MAG: alanine--tRNA ligase [Candidatus Nitrohelix vancouverensis]
MTGDELRQAFLDYFKGKGHHSVSSCSLIPQNDPTLLFTNAGMVQFKNIFLGEETSEHSRAVSCQKCVRAGGKHNDLEMVGRTARHHTFFEMLGNFSFGDYFKRDAIEYAWEFLTQNLGIPKDRLYASVFREDDEAYEFWKNDIHMPTERIFRMDEKDNFWAMGNTGPCGPCSEIYIDQGKELGCGKPDCTVGCDCDRYLEIWNLVFMQYDRDEAGKLSPLPKPCIDTGMGLERLTAVMQGRTSNYHGDLLMRHIQETASVTHQNYLKNKETDVSIRVITDHARATAFLIGDGVLPSNEGRGYVLRRIIRRALRHGKLLNQKDPFFYRIVNHVVEQFSSVYPDLKTHSEFIEKVALNEEESFGNTLTYGTQKLEEVLARVRKDQQKVIPGDEVFKLYDTFGFPVDLVEETARDEGLALDMEGFNKAMQEQKEKASASWKGSGEKGVSPVLMDFLKTKPEGVAFTGYGSVKGEGTVIALYKDQTLVESAKLGDEVEVIVDQTPFYGESGGQVGDAGSAYNENVLMEIQDALKPLPNLILHKAKIENGSLKTGDTLTLEVDPERRNSTALNHSATHLLHAALKETLGDHIKQAGSLVTPDRLRFDYTHFSALSDKEKEKIEWMVNDKIRENIMVETREMEIDEALKEGATALFGEKYGESVRVVSVPGFSKELCGGTHVGSTGSIGLFLITHEGSVASGVRRIEAVTGPTALRSVRREMNALSSIRSVLKAQPDEEVQKLKKSLEKNKELEKTVASLKEKLVSGKSSGMLEGVEVIDGVNALIKKLDEVDAKTLRSFIDNAKNQMKSGIVVAGTAMNGKVLLAAGVTADLTKDYHAGNILKEIAGIVGGSGGGRPDMAQAGGTQPEHLEQALNRARELVKKS